MKKYCLAIIGFFLSYTAVAQFDLSPFIQGSQSDINYLGGEYLNPAGKALATGINNGWYNSAETHKPGGFEINFSTGIIFVPKEDQSFIIQNSKLDELELVDPNDNIAPTAFGENSPGPELQSKMNPLTRFETPHGLGFNIFPQLGLTAQVGVGIHTDVMLRYFPTTGIIGIEDSKLGMYGFGINHTITDWFDSNDEFPVKASILFGYTKLDYTQGLSTSLDGDNQRLEFSTSGYTIRLLVSKKFNFLTLYGGVGVNDSKTNILLLGTYKYQSLGVQASTTDPLDIYQNSQTFAANLGFKLNFLKVMSFNADYNFGTYQSISVGLGVDVNYED